MKSKKDKTLAKRQEQWFKELHAFMGCDPELERATKQTERLLKTLLKKFGKGNPFPAE